MLASICERTDKIINYSGALNSSEEAIEAAVNASGTTILGVSNPTKKNVKLLQPEDSYITSPERSAILHSPSLTKIKQVPSAKKTLD